MSALKECSPPPAVENIQPMEIAHFSNNTTIENSLRANPTAAEFLNDFNAPDSMIISGKEEIFYDDKY
jgi:hypothetical protein